MLSDNVVSVEVSSTAESFLWSTVPHLDPSALIFDLLYWFQLLQHDILGLGISKNYTAGF